MKKRIAILFAVALMLTVCVIFATAQSGTGVRSGQQQGFQPPPPPPPPPPFGLPRIDRLAHDLNLTEAQVAELKAFMDTEHQTLDALMKKMDALRQQLDAATMSGQFDEAQVRSLATQQGQVLTELIVEHKRAEAKIYSLLTEEQRARFNELRQRRPGPPPPPPGDGPNGRPQQPPPPPPTDQ